MLMPNKQQVFSHCFVSYFKNDENEVRPTKIQFQANQTSRSFIFMYEIVMVQRSSQKVSELNLLGFVALYRHSFNNKGLVDLITTLCDKYSHRLVLHGKFNLFLNDDKHGMFMTVARLNFSLRSFQLDTYSSWVCIIYISTFYYVVPRYFYKQICASK